MRERIAIKEGRGSPVRMETHQPVYITFEFKEGTDISLTPEQSKKINNEVASLVLNNVDKWANANWAEADDGFNEDEGEENLQDYEIEFVVSVDVTLRGTYYGFDYETGWRGSEFDYGQIDSVDEDKIIDGLCSLDIIGPQIDKSSIKIKVDEPDMDEDNWEYDMDESLNEKDLSAYQSADRQKIKDIAKKAEKLCGDFFKFNPTTHKAKYGDADREQAIEDFIMDEVSLAQFKYIDESQEEKLERALRKYFKMRSPRKGQPFVFYGKGDLDSLDRFVIDGQRNLFLEDKSRGRRRVNESIDISEYQEVKGIKDGDKIYRVFRKIENGKGKWCAWETSKGNTVGEPFEITYEQALEREPIQTPSGVKELGKKLGKTLLPKREGMKKSFGDEDFQQKLKDELQNKLQKHYKKFGYTDREIEDYIMPIYKTELRKGYGDDGSDALFIWVGAEVDYDELEELANVLNRVIRKYDKEAYFEPETTGRLVAVLWE